MQNGQQQSLFNFIDPEYTNLSRGVKTFWNSAAVLIFISPYLMVITSCLGVVLGLTELQSVCPSMARGVALRIVDLVKVVDLAFTRLFVTVAFYERNELAEITRDRVRQALEELE